MNVSEQQDVPMVESSSDEAPYRCIRCQIGVAERHIICGACDDINTAVFFGIRADTCDEIRKKLCEIRDSVASKRPHLLNKSRLAGYHLGARPVKITRANVTTLEELAALPCFWCATYPESIFKDPDNPCRCPPKNPWFIGESRVYLDICRTLKYLQVTPLNPALNELVDQINEILTRLRYMNLGPRAPPPTGPINLRIDSQTNVPYSS